MGLKNRQAAAIGTTNIDVFVSTFDQFGQVVFGQLVDSFVQRFCVWLIVFFLFWFLFYFLDVLMEFRKDDGVYSGNGTARWEVRESSEFGFHTEAEGMIPCVVTGRSLASYIEE